MGHGSGHCVVHNIQTGISIKNDCGRVHLHHIGNKLLCLVNTSEDTIVTAVGSILAGQVVIAAEHIHKAHRKIQLLHTRLASRHIQLQIFSLKLPVLGL